MEGRVCLNQCHALWSKAACRCRSLNPNATLHLPAVRIIAIIEH